MNRRADLNPPLGSPGGPCRVVQRIQDRVRDPGLKDVLIQEVERGFELNNPSASKIYDVNAENSSGFFRQILIGPHAAYRMDLRTITVPIIKQAVQNFLQAMSDSKSRGGSEYKRNKEDLESGRTVEWHDRKLKVTVVLSLAGQGIARIVTVYWTGQKDPPPPRVPCPTRKVALGYREPASALPGVQTLVYNPDGEQRREVPSGSVAPKPRSRNFKQPAYNGPGSSGSSPDGKSFSQDKPRTLGQPGEEYGVPYIGPLQGGRKRRTMTGDFLYEKRPPDMAPESKYNRASNPLMWPHGEPGQTLDLTEVTDNPGSAKVIPEGRGFVNRQAYKIADIEKLCGEDLQRTSREVKAKLKRVDSKTSSWTFEVSGSKGPYQVKVKALPKRVDVKDPRKVDLLVSCSCPFWQWQGPEHWAAQNSYLLGRPRGTASKPVVKDPNKQHGACKHVLAALQMVKGYDIPGRGKKLASVWREETLIQRIARRYLQGGGEY